MGPSKNMYNMFRKMSDTTKFTELEDQVTKLLSIVSTLNKAIDEEVQNGVFFDDYDLNECDSDSDASDYSGRSAESQTSSKESEANAAEYLSVLPVVQYFIRQSGISTDKDAWSALLQRKSFL